MLQKKGKEKARTRERVTERKRKGRALRTGKGK